MNPSPHDVHVAVVTFWVLAGWMTSGVGVIAAFRWAKTQQPIDDDEPEWLWVWLFFGPPVALFVLGIVAQGVFELVTGAARMWKRSRFVTRFEKKFREQARGMSDVHYKHLRQDLGDEVAVCVGCQRAMVTKATPTGVAEPTAPPEKRLVVCSEECGLLTVARLRFAAEAFRAGLPIDEAIAAGAGMPSEADLAAEREGIEGALHV